MPIVKEEGANNDKKVHSIRKRKVAGKPSSAKRQQRSGVVRGQRNRVRDGGSTAVPEVHDRSRAHRSGRRPRDDQGDRGGHLSNVRGDSRKASAKAPTSHRSRRYSVDNWKVEPAFVDRKEIPLEQGMEVRFHSYQGNVMRATVEADHNLGRMVSIRVADDPFPVYVDHRQLQVKGRRNMARASAPAAAPTAKELRRKAKNLGVNGWEEMSREELQEAIDSVDVDEDEDEAVEEAPRRTKRTTKAKAAAKSTKSTTKAKSTKKTSKAAPRPAPKDGPNPFRAGSNLHKFTEVLMTGGKRSALVKKLLNGKDRVSYSPRVKSAKEFDEVEETDRRLKVIGYILRDDHGFEYEHEGRGPDAYIKCTPPA